MARVTDPVVAGVLSLLVPGIGHIYAGHVFWGILWLALTGGSWLLTAGCLSIVVHGFSAWHGYRLAGGD